MGQEGAKWGIRGIPETFVVDKKGKIIFEQIGPLSPEILENELFPLIDRLQEQSPG
jgi:cytochrome c biogenesis protein CcmG/thiol:disulfide interchange protein DsbE